MHVNIISHKSLSIAWDQLVALLILTGPDAIGYFPFHSHRTTLPDPTNEMIAVHAVHAVDVGQEVQEGHWKCTS